MQKRLVKNIAITTAIITFVAIVITVLYIYNPLQYNIFPKCPFLTLTGYQCPGCGSQRAIHYILNLQFKDAFLVNPLLVLSIPYLLLSSIVEQLPNKENKKIIRLRRILTGSLACKIWLVIIITYWIGRNIWL